MSQVTVEYLQSDGRYRRQRATIEPKWPNYALNKSDKQAHDLIDSPIFPIEKKPQIFRDWDDLIQAPPPPVPHIVDRVMMVCEDNSIWPVSCNSAPDLDDRQMSRKDHYEEGLQYARSAATRESQDNPFATAWSIVAMTVFGLASVLIALFFIQLKFGSQISEAIGAVAPQGPTFMVFFGALASLNPTKGSKSPLKWLSVRFARFRSWKRRPKREKPPNLGPLEQVRIFDELCNRPWSALVPLRVLADNLPATCRYTYEIGQTKWLAASIGAGIGFMVFCVPVLMAYGQILGVLAGFGGIPLGFGFGWFVLTPILHLQPIWVCRRMYVRNEDGSLDFERFPMIIEEEHTHLHGLPLEEARALRLAVAGKLAAGGGSGPSGSHGNSNNTSTLRPAMVYSPTVHRATTLFEEINQRDFREEFKGGLSLGKKIQIASFLMMAIGSVGLLVFLVLITQE